MNRHSTRLLGAGIALSALLLVGVTAAFAANGSAGSFFRGMMGGSGQNVMVSGPGGTMNGTGQQNMMNGQGSGGMMNGTGQQNMMNGQGSGGMMSGTFSMGMGMMSGWVAPPPNAKMLSIEQARQSVQRYIGRIGNQNLVIDEVIEFQRNFYAVVQDKSTGHGAFEVLVNKVTGAVIPEFGPAMMWNTQYGMMVGTMGSMMGYQQSHGPMAVSAAQAEHIAQRWLTQNQPGATTETPDQFPGYYTIHFLQNGKIAGMLSVNGYTGQVWYHSWHGTTIRVLEVGD
jgi:hypothetical protein